MSLHWKSRDFQALRSSFDRRKDGVQVKEQMGRVGLSLKSPTWAMLQRHGTGLLQKLAHIRRATSRLCYDTEPAEMALLPGRKTQVGKAKLPPTSMLIPLCFTM